MLRVLAILTLAASVHLFVACAGVAPSAPADKLTIKGALGHRAPVALAPDSRAIIEVRDVSRADGRVVAERRIDVGGREFPVAFEVPVDAARLEAGGLYAVRGAILSGARPIWASEPVMVDHRSGMVDVGTLEMRPVRVGAFATEFQCGDRRATIDYAQQAMRLTAGDERFDLRRVAAASGEKYEAVGDPTTYFWSRGDRATVAVKGRAYPECVKATDSPQGFRATGNEPGWRLDIDGDRMTFVTQSGEKRTATPLPAAQRTDQFTRYAARTAGGDITVTIFERLCRDSMTGMPHPNAVEVRFDGRTLKGCGGDPAALLRGAEWVVEDIARRGIIDRSRATLGFGPDGRLSGRASCNTYTAQYALSGEGMTVSNVAVTSLACASSLMAQEQLFLDVLRNASRFDIAADGALVLHATDGRAITARR